MPEGKMEITDRELKVFFGSVVIALFILYAGATGTFDPLTAGIAVSTIVVFFVLSQWLEKQGVFGSGMSMVFVVLGLSVVMIFAGLVYRGVLPLAYYSAGTPMLALAISNAMLYALVAMVLLALGAVVYVFYFRKK